MQQKLPFSLTTRKNSPYYYVRLRNEQTGKFLSWVSTKEKNYNRALRWAWDYYNQKASSRELQKISFYDTVRKATYTAEDVELFLEEFKRKGFISAYVKNDNSAANQNAMQWLLDFWDFEKSEYLREKDRKGQTVHKKHAENCRAFLLHYWAEIIKDKKLGEVSRSDVKKLFAQLDKSDLNGNSKNHILRSLLTPMKWAYNNELIAKDISCGWTMYKAVYQKRAILTMELAKAVFSVDWGNNKAKLASMLSMCTGMRCGEIQALTLEDLGENCIHVNHSWNLKDDLKSTKNGEARIVYMPFTSLMNELKKLGAENPYEYGKGYIFWGNTPNSPIDCKVFLKFFRRALVSIGLTKEEAEKYTFHSWRHFYTTYMISHVSERVLQSQTGHKTRIMLEHYANHDTNEAQKMIENAQTDVFGAILQK